MRVFEMSGLDGTGTISEGAITKLVQSEKDALYWVDYLGSASPTDWMTRANMAMERALKEVKVLNAQVDYKTGNREAEERVMDLWVEISKDALFMLRNEPSFLTQLAHRGKVFLTDVFAPILAAKDALINVATEKAMSLLGEYHKYVNTLRKRKRELQEVKANRELPDAVINARAVEISGAEKRMASLKALVRRLAGVDLDEVAAEEYGPFLANPGVPVVVVIVIAAAAAVIAGVGGVIAGILPLKQKAEAAVEKVKQLVGIIPYIAGGGILLIAGVLYFTLRK